MIYGFDIMTAIPEDLAFRIGRKFSQHYYDTPVNNSIRSVMVNYSFGNYILWLNINASVLVCGKETFDILLTKEPDFAILDETFKIHLEEIFGKINILPPLQSWGLHM
ncbi:MAG: hypothetical protein FWF15_07535, partial [Oscillospiraceae bacterium]|nr:hypothetical protein [Oscillospiraceae bacterium]